MILCARGDGVHVTVPCAVHRRSVDPLQSTTLTVTVSNVNTATELVQSVTAMI